MTTLDPKKWPVTSLVLAANFDCRWESNSIYNQGCRVRSPLTHDEFMVMKECSSQLNGEGIMLLPVRRW